ncbi:hypothetical protein ACTFIW_003101 [Dictyostelium discoideum]
MKKRTRDNNNNSNNNNNNNEEEVDNIKKLKEDNNNKNNENNNNNNENNNNKIKSYEEELKSIKSIKKSELSIKRLQSISKEIGLPINGKKDEIYNRIEQYYNIKIKLEKEAKEHEEKNPFNKTKPILLIENDDEIPFWKVFRNKSIFKKLFSNFKYSETFSYSRIHSVFYIFKDFKNAIEIIRDKVKSNSYLNFRDYNGLTENDFPQNEEEEKEEDDYEDECFIGLVNILDNIRDETEENRLFYDKFIDNYCNKSVHSIVLLARMVTCSNLVALKSFINKKIYLPSVNFRPIIKRFSDIKTLEYLINLEHVSVTSIIASVHDFNLFKELKLGELIHMIKILYQKEKISKFLDLPYYHNFIIKLPDQDTLSPDDEDKLIDEQFKQHKLEFREGIIKKESIINEIKDIQFSNKELNENLFMVLKPLTNWDKYFSKLNDNYKDTSSSNNNDNDNNNNNDDENGSGELSLLKFNILELYNNKFKKNFEKLQVLFNVKKFEFPEKDFQDIENIHKEQIEIEKEMKILFKKQNELIEKQKQEKESLQSEDIVKKRDAIHKYIELLFFLTSPRKKPIEYYLCFKDEKEIILNGKNSRKELLKIGTPTNEILSGITECLQITKNKLELIMHSNFLIEKPYKYMFEDYFGTYVINNVKSIDMLDLLFKNFPNKFFKNDNQIWTYCNSIEILKHYEKLMESLGRKFSLDYYYGKLNEMYPKLLKRAISNPKLYQRPSSSSSSSATPNLSSSSSSSSSSSYEEKPFKISNIIVKERAFLSLLELNYFKTIVFGKKFQFNKNSFKISRWISDNCISDISKITFNEDHLTKIYIQLPNIKCNKNDQNDEGYYDYVEDYLDYDNDYDYSGQLSYYSSYNNNNDNNDNDNDNNNNNSNNNNNNNCGY